MGAGILAVQPITERPLDHEPHERPQRTLAEDLHLVRVVLTDPGPGLVFEPEAQRLGQGPHLFGTEGQHDFGWLLI